MNEQNENLQDLKPDRIPQSVEHGDRRSLFRTAYIQVATLLRYSPRHVVPLSFKELNQWRTALRAARR